MNELLAAVKLYVTACGIDRKPETSYAISGNIYLQAVDNHPAETLKQQIKDAQKHLEYLQTQERCEEARAALVKWAGK